VIPDNSLPEAIDSQGGIPLYFSDSSVGGLEVNSIFPDQFQGRYALATFESVGAVIDQVIFRNDITEEKDSDHRMTSEQFEAELPELIADAERGGVSFIARVRGPVLQLDDCDAEAVKLLKPFSFMVEETSENNYQTWLAFKDDQDKGEIRDDLFRRLREIAPGVNCGSGGATRWPGSINFKPERNGWRVRLVYVNQGRVTTPAELDDAGLLADPDIREFDWKADGPPGDWPDYIRCLEDVPKRERDGQPDRSRADAQFVFFSLRRRRSVEEITVKLFEVSDRARESGQKYIERTIAAAVDFLNGRNFPGELPPAGQVPGRL